MMEIKKIIDINNMTINKYFQACQSGILMHIIPKEQQKATIAMTQLLDKNNKKSINKLYLNKQNKKEFLSLKKRKEIWYQTIWMINKLNNHNFNKISIKNIKINLMFLEMLIPHQKLKELLSKKPDKIQNKSTDCSIYLTIFLSKS